MVTKINRVSFLTTLLPLLIFSGASIIPITATAFDKIDSLTHIKHFSDDRHGKQAAAITLIDTHSSTLMKQKQSPFRRSEPLANVDPFYAEQHLQWPPREFQVYTFPNKRRNSLTYISTNTPSTGRARRQLINVKDFITGVIVEARYNTAWNFTGTIIPGYKENVCLLSKQAVKQLAFVQQEVSKRGYSLLIFDCYRPIKAVNHFVTWAKNYRQTKMKKIFYPTIYKSQLIPEYISNHSSHSRGSAIDLTLVHSSKKLNVKIKPLQFRESMTDCRSTRNIGRTGQLNMGTSFDCFSPLSHTFSKKISKTALKNRMILKTAMEKFGFKNYSKEWWHYTLINEPYKQQYFNFDVD